MVRTRASAAKANAGKGELSMFVGPFMENGENKRNKKRSDKILALVRCSLGF